ncbi:MAG: OsmC family protein [Ignavibacteria bacterium]|nr:OsmC family protein [Ignavibacteria bacterium]
MNKEHQYQLKLNWTGNTGLGTADYRSYHRSYTVSINGKADILGSSDTPFRGDGAKHNPEEFLLMAIASCHMLWYLHLCADAGIVVIEYHDEAKGKMIEVQGGGGKFEEVVLHPVVVITDATMIEKANQLHSEANKKCFISNSCNFPIWHLPVCKAV